jgi:hypothetical protein
VFLEENGEIAEISRANLAETLFGSGICVTGDFKVAANRGILEVSVTGICPALLAIPK